MKKRVGLIAVVTILLAAFWGCSGTRAKENNIPKDGERGDLVIREGEKEQHIYFDNTEKLFKDKRTGEVVRGEIIAAAFFESEILTHVSAGELVVKAPDIEHQIFYDRERNVFVDEATGKVVDGDISAAAYMDTEKKHLIYLNGTFADGKLHNDTEFHFIQNGYKVIHHGIFVHGIPEGVHTITHYSDEPYQEIMFFDESGPIYYEVRDIPLDN